MQGTSVPAIKAAFVTLLNNQTSTLAHTTVSYARPIIATDVQGDTGLTEAIWFEGPFNHKHEIPAMRGGGVPLIIEEEYVLGLVVQVVADDTDRTAQQTETRASEMLGAVYSVVAADPQLGLGANYMLLTVVPETAEMFTDPVDPGPRPACRFDVSIKVNCRIN